MTNCVSLCFSVILWLEHFYLEYSSPYRLWIKPQCGLQSLQIFNYWTAFIVTNPYIFYLKKKKKALVIFGVEFTLFNSQLKIWVCRFLFNFCGKLLLILNYVPNTPKSELRKWSEGDWWHGGPTPRGRPAGLPAWHLLIRPERWSNAVWAERTSHSHVEGWKLGTFFTSWDVIK